MFYSNYIFKISILVLISLIIAFLMFRYSEDSIGYNVINWSYTEEVESNFTQKILTAKGEVTYNEVEKNVFRPLGYKIVVPNVPIPVLERLERQSCYKIMSEWLEISKNSDQFRKPPTKVPEDKKAEFLLYGYSNFFNIYKDDRAKPVAREWSMIDSWMELPDNQLFKISNYGKPGLTVNSAFEYYQEELRGKRLLVVGSQIPWVEVLGLRNGLREVVTLEYQKTTIVGNTRITYVHPMEFANNYQRYIDYFDVAVSYSSIEHSGLGRYGDALDPIGDIREVDKISCVLKTNGFLFIGVPRGMDGLVFNAHRMYGRMRLAMLFTGFHYIHSFREFQDKPSVMLEEDFSKADTIGPQDLHVLRKL